MSETMRDRFKAEFGYATDVFAIAGEQVIRFAESEVARAQAPRGNLELRYRERFRKVLPYVGSFDSGKGPVHALADEVAKILAEIAERAGVRE